MTRNTAWTIALLVAGLYLFGFLAFVLSLPHAPDGPVHADGIVALTGGDSRIGTAEKLLEDGMGKRLLISGVNKSITKQELKRLVQAGPRFDCCADLGFSAESTHDNATEAAAWARSHRYRSLLIVTANFHMPRTLNEFSSEMPGMRLRPYPVAEDNVDVGEWWSNPRTLRVLHFEYAKYLGSLFFTALASPHAAHRERWRTARAVTS